MAKDCQRPQHKAKAHRADCDQMYSASEGTSLFYLKGEGGPPLHVTCEARRPGQWSFVFSFCSSIEQ